MNLGTAGGGSETISYKGKATILVKGSAAINLTLLAEPNFPQENIIGIMAGESMIIGQDPHTDIMGLFYAEQNISIKKQTNILGSVVANLFTMDQVPAIFQVPSTLDHLPPHIIGDQPLWLTRVVSWQKE